jgi:hypothetical protein
MYHCPDIIINKICWYLWHQLQSKLCGEYHNRFRDYLFSNHNKYFKEFYLYFGQSEYVRSINFRYLHDVQQSKYNGEHYINYLNKPNVLGGIGEVPQTYYYSSGNENNTRSFSFD